MVEDYICNRCGFGSDEVDEGIDASKLFEVMYEEFYCDGCMNEYRSGAWRFEQQKAHELFELISDKANELENREPTMAQVYDALRRRERDPNDYQANWVLSRVTVTSRGKA